MRYLVHETQRHELSARQDYLFDIFKMYFLPGDPEGSYIPLRPVGADNLDILFITGHTHLVKEYLEKHISSIPEKTIVITSCMGQAFKTYSSAKKIFVPDSGQVFCQLRNGEPYGFGFPISDAELDFHNARGTILEKIHAVYKCL